MILIIVTEYIVTKIIGRKTNKNSDLKDKSSKKFWLFARNFYLTAALVQNE
jgi:hypothetical protein